MHLIKQHSLLLASLVVILLTGTFLRHQHRSPWIPESLMALMMVIEVGKAQIPVQISRRMTVHHRIVDVFLKPVTNSIFLDNINNFVWNNITQLR